LVGSTQFQSLLKNNSFKLTGDQKNTTGTNISTTYLGQLVEQSRARRRVHAPAPHGLGRGPEQCDQAGPRRLATASEIGRDASGNQTFIGPGVVFASFPKSLQNDLIDRQARRDAGWGVLHDPDGGQGTALYDEFATDLCPSGRVVSQILVKDVATARAILGQLHAGCVVRRPRPGPVDRQDLGEGRRRGRLPAQG